MYKSKLFTILILTLSLPVVMAATSPNLVRMYNGSQNSDYIEDDKDVSEIEVPVSTEGYKKFNEFIDDLENQITKISDLRSRVSYLHSRLDELEKEREAWAYGRVEDEISMDIIIGVLHEVPKGDHFTSKNCKLYRSRIFTHYEPTSTSDDEPKEPSVQRAYKIFKKICP